MLTKLIMKNLLIAISVIFFSSPSFSQESELKLAVNYPLSMGNNFLGKVFTGQVDLGAKYTFSERGIFKLGTSFNAGMLSYNSNENIVFTDFKITSYILQPRAYAELDINEDATFRPFMGLGYSFVILDASGMNRADDISDADDLSSGINLNVGAIGYMTDDLFIQAQYDFIKFLAGDQAGQDEYFNQAMLFKAGIGYRF